MNLLLIHALATLAMTGVIWFVQVVHYPLFDFVPRDRFESFAAAHQRLTTRVVAPLMLLELGCAVLLVVEPPAGIDPALPWAGVLLLAVVWISTALVQVPLHRHLAGGKEAGSIRRLVSSNWLRTVAWSLRAALALGLLASAVPRAGRL